MMLFVSEAEMEIILPFTAKNSHQYLVNSPLCR